MTKQTKQPEQPNLGHLLALAVISQEHAANTNHMAEHSLANAGRAIADLALTEHTQAANMVRVCLAEIITTEIDQDACVAYCERAAISIPTVVTRSTIEKGAGVSLDDVKNVLRSHRAKAATTAIRRALPDTHALEIGKEREVENKTIVFRELTAGEQQAKVDKTAANKDAKEKKELQKQAEKLAKDVKSVEVTDSQLVGIVVAKLDRLDNDTFTTLLNAVLGEQAGRSQAKHRSTHKTPKAVRNTVLADALTKGQDAKPAAKTA